MASIVLCVVAVVGIAIYFALPTKKHDTKLVVDAGDMSIVVGESKKIEYECSCVDAVISFKVEDESIAFVSAGANGVEIVGRSVGETLLTIEARYKRESVEKSVVIKVERENSVPEDSEEDDGAEGVVPQLIIVEENLVNCEVVGESLRIGVLVKGIFALSSDMALTKEIEIVNDNTELEIKRALMIGNNTYSIKADSIGEYNIKVRLEDKFEYELTIIVE